MAGGLAGKVAVITGGGRGIGCGIATAFVREGAAVMVASRTIEQIEGVARELRSCGGEASACVTDVSNEESVQRLIEETVNEFGHIDVMVNSAGVAHKGAVTHISDADWDRLMGINVSGTFLCSQKAVRHMLTQGIRGSIINISSYGGKVGLAFSSLYYASKFAVLGLTESMGRELASCGIRVNAICPGRIEMRMMAETVAHFAADLELPADEMRGRLVGQIPWGRMGSVDEIAQVAIFLASDASSYITSQAINVNGGLDTT